MQWYHKGKSKPFEKESSAKQDRKKERKKLDKKDELNETPSEEKSEKCDGQQSTSISGSNNKTS